MNAIQFIKDHGVEKARKHYQDIREAANQVSFVHACEPFASQLNRLIESVDLVGKIGGISKAKAQVKQAHEHGYQTMSIPVEINGSIGMGCLYIDTLEKAIADYEAIGGEYV